MKRKISLLLAIVMIATTVMAAMPVMAFTAVAAETPAISIYRTDANAASGYSGDALATCNNFDDVDTEVNKLSGDVTVVLNANVVSKDCGYSNNFNGARTITFNGQNLYSVTATDGTYNIDTSSGVNTNFIFKDITLIKTSGTGNMIRTRSNVATITFDNAKVYTYTQYGALNLLGGSNMTFNVELKNNSFIIEGNNNVPAIKTGNDGAKTVNITVNNSSIYGAAAIAQMNSVSLTLNLNNAHLYASTLNAVQRFNNSGVVNEIGTVETASSYTNSTYSAPATGKFGPDVASGVTAEHLTSFPTVTNAAQFGFVVPYVAALPYSTTAWKVELGSSIDLKTNQIVLKATDAQGTRPIIIDGKGYTITTSGKYAFDASGAKADLTITNVTIDYTATGSNSGNIFRFGSEYATVTLDNVLAKGAPQYGILNTFTNRNSNAEKTHSVTVKDSVLINTTSGIVLRTGNNDQTGDAKKVIFNVQNTILLGGTPIDSYSKTVLSINISNSDLISNAGGKAIAAGATVTGTITGSNFYTTAEDVVTTANVNFGTYTKLASINVNDSASFARAVYAAIKLPAEFVIKLTADITTKQETFYNGSNVIIDGDNGDNDYTLTVNYNGKANPDNDCFHLRGAGKVTFRNINMILNNGNAGNGIEMTGGALALTNANVTVNGAKWFGISAAGTDKTHTIDITDSVLTVTNAKQAIRTGNADTKTVTINISGSEISSYGDLVSVTNKSVTTATITNSVLKGAAKAVAIDDTASSVTIDADSIMMTHAPHTAATGSSITNNAKGFAKIGDVEYTTWSELVTAANAANADVEIDLTRNAYHMNGTLVFNNSQKNPNETPVEIVFDGNGYTLYDEVDYGSFAPISNFEMKNIKVDFTGNRAFLHIGNNSGANFTNPCTVELNNVDIYAHGANEAAYAVINAFGHGETATDAANRQKITLKMYYTNIVTENTNADNQLPASVIRYGNGNDDMDILMFNSTIDATKDGVRAGIYAPTNATGSIKLVHSEIKTNEGTNAILGNANIAIEKVDSSITGVANSATNEVKTNVTMKEGASVRLSSGSNGIRFTSTIPAATLEAIAAIADNTDFNFGTIITVEEAVDANGGVFKPTAEMIANGTFGGWKIRNIPGVIDNGVTVNAPAEGATYGDVEIRAALVNIKDEHIKTEYAAVAYVEYTYMGETCYAYSDYDPANNRSMYYIATKALEDLKAPEDDGYDPAKHLYEVGGKYSPYTGAQRNTLQAYIDKADALTPAP